jgi:uncharacterized protein
MRIASCSIMSTRTSIDAFITEPAIAVVGASRSGRKFGNAACRTLRSKGYRVYPIHPTAITIDGEPCFRDLTSLPEPVTALLIVVPPAAAVNVMREAAAAGIRRVWLQQGAESPEALKTGAALGLDVIAGECILMFAAPTGFHKAHAWISGLWRSRRASSGREGHAHAA